MLAEASYTRLGYLVDMTLVVEQLADPAAD
jgi:hypothetical protein